MFQRSTLGHFLLHLHQPPPSHQRDISAHLFRKSFLVVFQKMPSAKCTSRLFCCVTKLMFAKDIPDTQSSFVTLILREFTLHFIYFFFWKFLQECSYLFIPQYQFQIEYYSLGYKLYFAMISVAKTLWGSHISLCTHSSIQSVSNFIS